MCCPHSIREGKPEILTISLTHLGTWSQAVARAHISEGLTQSRGRQLTQLPCTTTLLYSSNICYLFDPPQYLYESSQSCGSFKLWKLRYLLFGYYSTPHHQVLCDLCLGTMKPSYIIIGYYETLLYYHRVLCNPILSLLGTMQPSYYHWVLYNPYIIVGYDAG